MELKLLLDPIFLIGLTFLGIVVPIFTLSISLIGHAVERSKDKISETRKKAEEELKKEVDILEEKLKESKRENILEKSQKIEIDLNNLKDSRRRFEKESTAIIKRYDMLKFKQSVLIPGFLFLCTIIFVLVAKFCIIPLSITLSLIASLVFLIIGIYRVCKSLSVIQEVGLSSDKYQQEKMFEAISKAFESRAEAEQPVLFISFRNPEAPFKFPKSSEIDLSFRLELKQGKIAKVVKVLFLVPKEFDFPKVKSKWNQEKDHDIPNALTTEIVMGDIRRGIFSFGVITIKTPDKEGNYRMLYNLSSEEFNKREFIDVTIT